MEYFCSDGDLSSFQIMTKHFSIADLKSEMEKSKKILADLMEEELLTHLKDLTKKLK
jgi:hypothetical protein